MTSNKNTSKAVETEEAVEAEANVPHQNTGGNLVELKDRLLSDDEKAGMVEKFKKLIRNKKVLSGLGAVAAVAVIAVVRTKMTSSEETVAEPEDSDTTE